MKRLIVMRHAKSSWKNDALTDHQRPLNKRGKRDAPAIGAALAARGWVPDLALSSDAERTRQTWRRLVAALPEEPPVRWVPAFYCGSAVQVLEQLLELPEEIETVLVLGHNPGWENTVALLAGRVERMTTANAALLEGEGTWAALSEPDAWRLITVLRPKEL